MAVYIGVIAAMMTKGLAVLQANERAKGNVR
jgi:hypothetical protein